MTVNRINGTLFSALSALNGTTLSTLTAVNGQTIAGGGSPSAIIPFLAIPETGRIKPAIGYRLNSAHPLASGLVFYAIPGGPHREEHVGKGLGTVDGSGTFGFDGFFQPEGPVTQINGTNRRLYYPWNPAIESITDQATILIRILFFSVQNFSHIFNFPYRANGTWTSPFVSMNIQRSGTTSSMIFNYASAGSPIAATSDTGIVLADSVFRTIGATRSGPDVKFYVDGFQSGAAKTLGTNTATDWGSRAKPTISNRASDTSGEDTGSTVSWAAAWNRCLSPEEVKHMHYAPFQVLIP